MHLHIGMVVAGGLFVRFSADFHEDCKIEDFWVESLGNICETLVLIPLVLMKC